jgi:hypothetical protein
LTKLIMKYLAQGDRFSLPSKLYSSEVDQEELNLLLTAIYLILRQAIRTKSKLSVVRADLTKMKLPASFSEAVCLELGQSRMAIESIVLANRLQFAKLEKVRWRIDVVISSGSLSRIMRPSILMQVFYIMFLCFASAVADAWFAMTPQQMILKNGSVKTFEISIEQFNQLRYSVAKVRTDNINYCMEFCAVYTFTAFFRFVLRI